MSIENRQVPRFQDFARARLNELCPLPGFLEDVSKNGCRVRFSNFFAVDIDREYTLTIQPALRSGIKEFELVVQPQWVSQGDDSLEIGFVVLRSPGICQFNRYVAILAGQYQEQLQEA
jgi:hypothetical protein